MPNKAAIDVLREPKPETVRNGYEVPGLVEVGDVVSLTNGSTSNDTADKRAYYY